MFGSAPDPLDEKYGAFGPVLGSLGVLIAILLGPLVLLAWGACSFVGGGYRFFRDWYRNRNSPAA